MMIDVTRVGKVLSRKIRGLSRDMRIVVVGLVEVGLSLRERLKIEWYGTGLS